MQKAAGFQFLKFFCGFFRIFFRRAGENSGKSLQKSV